MSLNFLYHSNICRFILKVRGYKSDVIYKPTMLTKFLMEIIPCPNHMNKKRIETE